MKYRKTGKEAELTQVKQWVKYFYAALTGISCVHLILCIYVYLGMGSILSCIQED